MNIQMLDEAADWDQIEERAASVDGAIVYFENPRLESADDSVKESVIEYYQFQEDVPIELISNMKLKYYGYIQFRDADVAFDFVTDYFPRRDELPDGEEGDPYWYQCYIVRKDGVVEYDNKALRPGNNR
jgi:hypothetical protein